MTHIGLVDDHTLVRKGLITLIDSFPNHQVVIEASNGKDYIKKLETYSDSHIVLLDIHMAEMDGYETAKWIKVNRPDIKVIALSSMDAELSIIRMLHVGAKGYLLKDVEPDELKKAFIEVQTLGYHTNNVVSRTFMNNINQITDEKNPMAMFLRLNDRELTFLKLACSDKPYKEIAAQMHLSERTIDGYRESLFQKFGVTSRVGLAIYAIKNGLVNL